MDWTTYVYSEQEMLSDLAENFTIDFLKYSQIVFSQTVNRYCV